MQQDQKTQPMAPCGQECCLLAFRPMTLTPCTSRKLSMINLGFGHGCLGLDFFGVQLRAYHTGQSDLQPAHLRRNTNVLMWNSGATV